jgi:macrolide transport system ATP-binding/permease protein
MWQPSCLTQNLMSAFTQNLTYSLRSLRKSPSFTFVTVLTLALGIGANTAIFSVVYYALLRPLPYHQPSELVMLGEWRRQEYPNPHSSYPDYLDWKKTAKSFSALAGYSGDAFTFSAGGEPKNTFAGQVTPNFFSTLGVKPMLGRDFRDSDQQLNEPPVAMLTYDFWRSDFSADQNVIGRVIHLDGKPVVVVGVLPKEFEFALRTAPLYVPLHPGPDASARRSLRWLNVVCRLAPGVSLTQALAEMNGIEAQLAIAYPKENSAIHLSMGPLRNAIVGKVQPLLLVLLGAVGFVLLITCANVANLLITRSLGRRKELAVRAALGASRTNLVWQSLTESLLLSFFGAAVGLMAARWGIDLLIAAIPQPMLLGMPYLRDAGINLPVLIFLCAITILTGVLFGLAPGWSASNTQLNDALKDESRGGTSSVHGRLRNTLVIVEVAISLVLLVGASLMLQSLSALLKLDTGMDVHHVLTFGINLPSTSYPSEKTYPFNSPSALRFEHDFGDQLRNVPGILNVATASGIPANGGSGSIRFVEEGRPATTGQEDECDILTVNSTYYATLKIPLVAGRVFTRADTLETPNVVVVNRAFAKSYFPNEDPVGKRIRFTFNAKEPYRQIVGVVGDTRENDLAATPQPIVYYPNDQGPNTFMAFLVRTAGDPAAFVGAARETLHKLDPELPLIQPQSLDEVAQQSPSVFLRRYPSYLIGSFAILAVVLAMVGLYGLISHTILQRTREIGIRVTLGAQRRDILRLVLYQGLSSALIGIGIGVVAGLALTRLLSSLLFGVKASDWLTFAGVAAVLLLVSQAACLIPARRAMTVDPMSALRQN